MAGLNKQDMEILGHYAKKGNRELYWNYLAQTPGNDGYGLLALGVVRNDNMPGALANQYAQNQAQSVNGVRLSERHTFQVASGRNQRTSTPASFIRSMRSPRIRRPPNPSSMTKTSTPARRRSTKASTKASATSPCQ